MTVSSADPLDRRTGIAVLDLGATHTRLMLFNGALRLVEQVSVPSEHVSDGPYPSLRLTQATDLIREYWPRLDRLLPIAWLVPCAHGSALALLNEAGNLALPIMDYIAQPPEDVAEEYSVIAPEYGEVFSPTNPAALTLGRQLLWQQRHFPVAFEQVTQIMPLAQYLGVLLGGQACSEITSLAAQTHLWDVRANKFSKLAVKQGWAQRFSPLLPAWAVSGITNGGATQVLAGVHDSNANLLRYLVSGHDRFTLLSSGTWIIGMANGASLSVLRPGHDLVSNTSVFGKAVPCCRFMGGEEYRVICDELGCEPIDTAAHSTQDEVVQALEAVFESGAMALPAFTDSGGPIPGRGGCGRLVGVEGLDQSQKRALAAVYCALMCVESLEALEVTGKIIVDGPFAENQPFLHALGLLMPTHPIYVSSLAEGTASGAAALAVLSASNGKLPRRSSFPLPLRPLSLTRLSTARLRASDYQQRWRQGLRSNV
ncbi:MAG: FGGY-family carbohydrate kinase [Burkholderiaceae bacterium]